MNNEGKPPIKPCIKVCVFEFDKKLNDELCIGCFRTRGDIIKWKAGTPNQQRSVEKRLPKQALYYARKSGQSVQTLANKSYIAKKERLESLK